MNYHFLYILFFFIFPFTVFSQVGGLVNYTQEDGLNATFTYRMSQDRDGFIWIGSDNGLFRFDGSSFKQYNQKDGLVNIDVLHMRALKDGSIFIFCFQDYALMANGKIRTARNDREIAKIKPGKRFTSLPFFNPDTEEIMLAEVMNPKELYFLRNGKIRVEKVHFDYEEGKPNLYSLMGFDFDNYLYLQSFEKVYRVDIRTGQYQVLKGRMPKLSNGLKRLGKTEFLSYYENTFDIVDIHRNSKKTVICPKTIFEVNQLGKYLWVSFTNGGAYCYDRSQDPDLKRPVLFMEPYILNDIFMDRDGNIWFSSKNNGIFFLAERFFKNYYSLPLKQNNKYVTAIAGNAKQIFLGYNDGAFGVYERGRIENLSLGGSSQSENRAIYADKRGVVFGMNSGMFGLALPDRDIKRFKSPKPWIAEYVVKNIVPDSPGSLLVCNADGLYQFDLGTGTAKPLHIEKCYTALRYDRDSIFFGNFKDLYKLCVVNGRKQLFISDRYFTDIKKIRKGLYVGATNGNGIYVFSDRKILRHISESDGLASNQVKRISLDGEVIWASTNSGLCRIDLSLKKPLVHNFTRIDGLPSDRVSGCVIRGDTVFAGTDKGMAILPVKNLLGQESFVDKKVAVTSVKIGNREILQPGNFVRTLFPDNNLTINLAYPDYESQGKVSYRYRINGLNDQWQNGSSPKILLNALQPGKYELTVYGISYNGRRSREPTVFFFEIEPRFWQTWWFGVIVFIGVSSLIAVSVIYLLQRMRDKKLRELLYDKKIAELELQAIKAQINPHFIYNCLNSIQLLLHKNGYSGESRTYLSSFSRLIRQTLHYSEKTFMPLYEEIEYLELYLQMEKIRFKSHFDYQIELAGNVNQNWGIPSLLIQPFVENAIKHGIANLKDRKGNIAISFEFNEPILCITIRDNGAGITDKELLMKKMDSFGIKLSHKRIETFRQLFDTTIILEINDLYQKGGIGTEVKIYVNKNESKN